MGAILPPQLMEIPSTTTTDWDACANAVGQRFDREVAAQVGGKAWELPADLMQLPFWQACQHDRLGDRLGVPFFELRTPKKRERCLDIGCGFSFLIYPWSHWEADFFGHDVSTETVQFVQSRGPQLNSKLFKSLQRGAAHRLDRYDTNQFDLAIATGFLYYYPLEYFQLVGQQLRRVLRPGAMVVLEVVDPDSPWVDEWGSIEVEKGTEPLLTPLSAWEAIFKQEGVKIRKQARGELFVTYAIALPA